MTDIIERLYDRRVCSAAQNSCRNDYICEEAAAEITRLRDKNQELMEAVAMADWHFRGANMNMKALEKKITDALWCLGGEKDDG